MDRYMELYSTYLQQNSLVQRAFQLQEIMTYPPSLSMTNEWEAINKLRVVGMQQAERGCRKFRTGAIAWSQTWQLIRDKIEVWALVRRHKEGKKVSSRFLRRKNQVVWYRGCKYCNSSGSVRRTHQRTHRMENSQAKGHHVSEFMD